MKIRVILEGKTSGNWVDIGSVYFDSPVGFDLPAPKEFKWVIKLLFLKLTLIFRIRFEATWNQ